MDGTPGMVGDGFSDVKYLESHDENRLPWAVNTYGSAAAQAVVEAAGGLVTDTQLQPLRYNTKESLLNPHFLVFGDRSEDWGRYL